MLGSATEYGTGTFSDILYLMAVGMHADPATGCWGLGSIPTNIIRLNIDKLRQAERGVNLGSPFHLRNNLADPLYGSTSLLLDSV